MAGRMRRAVEIVDLAAGTRDGHLARWVDRDRGRSLRHGVAREPAAARGVELIHRGAVEQGNEQAVLLEKQPERRTADVRLPRHPHAGQAHRVHVPRRAVRDVGRAAIVRDDDCDGIAADVGGSARRAILQREEDEAGIRICRRCVRRGRTAAGADCSGKQSERYLRARSTGSVASWNALAAGRMCIRFRRCWIAPFSMAARSLCSEKSVLKSRRL